MRITAHVSLELNSRIRLSNCFALLESTVLLWNHVWNRCSRLFVLSCLVLLLTLSGAQAALAQAAMSEAEMQQMLNQMNSWQQPQGNGGGGMHMQQHPMHQQMPNQMQHLQQELNSMPQFPMQQQQYPMQQMQHMPMQQMQQMPMQQMHQMPMQQMHQMPMQQMQQMPMQQMQQMPMQQMHQMPMQQMRPMQMMQQMNQGVPLDGGMGSGAQMNPGIGDKFNMSNIMGRKLVGNGGMGGGIFQKLSQMNAASAQNPNSSASSQSARDDIQYQLSVARSMASQAVAYSNRARSGNDQSAKRSAASESRYYATQARVAAERAESRVWECPEASGMASSARGESNRAQSAASYAADAASGW